MGSFIHAETVLAVARSYIGVTEDPPGSNKVLFNTAYYGREVSGSDYPWCMVFQWYIFRDAGASALFFGGEKTASCGALMRYAKSTGRWLPGNFKPGDLIIWDFEEDGNVDTDHVGICESVDGNYITTIDGNTGTASEANGGAVMRRKRELKYAVGAYRPAYDPTAQESKEIIKAKAGVSDDYIQHLWNYRWGDDGLIKLAKAMM